MSRLIFTEQNTDGITTNGDFHLTYQTTSDHFNFAEHKYCQNISLFTVYHNVENLQMRFLFLLNETVVTLNAFIPIASDFDGKISTIFNETRPTNTREAQRTNLAKMLPSA